jgi:hypothetical protein
MWNSKEQYGEASPEKIAGAAPCILTSPPRLTPSSIILDKAKSIATLAVDEAEKLKIHLSPAVKKGVTVAGEQMDSAAKQWAKFREENPKTDKAVIKIGETLEDVQQRLSEIGDNVSGAKVLEQANALISQQKKYNDVLATRLAEALDEIRTLRARVDVLEARK